MPKVTLTTLTSGRASIDILNSNFAIIQAAFDDFVSRAGLAPNTMGASLDMNSHGIVNLLDPVNPQDAASKAYVDGLAFGTPLSFTSIPFNTTAGISVVEGELAWNDTDGTVNVGLKGGVLQLPVGLQMTLRVRNNTGVTLTKGQVVYISGALGSRPTVALSNNTTEATSSPTVGVVAEPILNNTEGFVQTFGLMRGLNTSGFTEGAHIWLNNTPGTYTETKPLTPAHLTLIGYVVRAHPTDGYIFVKVINYNELGELHDVLCPTPINGDFLQWDGVNSYWKNTTRTASGVMLSGADGSSEFQSTKNTNGSLVQTDAGKVIVALTGCTALTAIGANFGFTTLVNLTAATLTFSVPGGMTMYYPDGTATAGGSISVSPMGSINFYGSPSAVVIIDSSGRTMISNAINNNEAIALGQADARYLKSIGGTLTGALQIRPAGDASIEHGRIDGVASTPLIDFHSGATSVDYDSRIIASGGSGVAGGGSINVVASALNFNGNQVLHSGGIPVYTSQNLNTFSLTGFSYHTTPTSAPTSHGFLINEYVNANYQHQEWTDLATAEKYTRNKVGGVWSAWTAIGTGGGATTLPVSSKSAAYSVVAGDVGTMIDCTTGTFTVTLLAPATAGNGFLLAVRNSSATATDIITVTDGTFSKTVPAGCSIIITCNGTTYKIASDSGYALGDNQTEQIVTGSRVLGTTYQNTTGKTIFVGAAVTGGGGGVQIVGYIGPSSPAGYVIDSAQTATTSGIIGVTFAVRPNAFYRIAITGGVGTLSNWTEIRA